MNNHLPASSVYPVSRAEWRWAAVVSLIVLAVSSIPIVAGYLLEADGRHFVGAVVNIDDYQTYLAKMWLGYRGGWRYYSLATPEPHQGAFLFTFYLALGHLARLTGWSLPLAFHLARLAGGLTLLLTAYRFIAAFVEGETRRVTFLLTATSSGLGWLLLLLPALPGGRIPTDFWLVEGYTFLTVMTFPHFSTAVALLLGFFIVMLPLMESGRLQTRSLLAAIILSWGVGIIHPYMLLVADAVPALYALWRIAAQHRRNWRPIPVLVIVGLAQLPLLGYYVYVFTALPHYQQWLAQSPTPSPPPTGYLLGYGLIVPLALWGVWRGRRSVRLPFLLSWLAVAFVLAYLPFSAQRRFLEGVHVPIALLAGIGLVHGMLGRLQRSFGHLASRLHYNAVALRWLAKTLTIFLAALTSIYLVTAHSVLAVAQPDAIAYGEDEAAAMAWLAEQTHWTDTILTSLDSGNYIIGTIGHRVVLGHWAETLNVVAKTQEVDAIYQDRLPQTERQTLLDKWGVGYVYVGPAERALNGFQLDTTGWTAVFQQGNVTIYQRP